jgi:hypothetical protein
VKTYRIRSGCSFVRDDGSIATGGEEIELEDDVAAVHAKKIEPVQVPAQDEEAASE